MTGNETEQSMIPETKEFAVTGAFPPQNCTTEPRGDLKQSRRGHNGRPAREVLDHSIQPRFSVLGALAKKGLGRDVFVTQLVESSGAATATDNFDGPRDDLKGCSGLTIVARPHSWTTGLGIRIHSAFNKDSASFAKILADRLRL